MAGLISPDWLEEHLGDPSIVLLEVSFKTADEAGWSERHIPGAHWVYWKDVCWDETDRQFPGPEVMASRLASYGATDDTTVVLIGDPVQFATYPYWICAMAGLEDRVAVLDGGRQGWIADGRIMDSEVPPPPTPGSVTPGEPVVDARVGRDEVLAGLGAPGRTLFDLRSEEEFRGERVSPTTAPFDHGAERSGRIPGARHVPHSEFLTDGGRFLGADAIREVADRADGDIITYCRLSHRASLGWFAMTRISDRDDVRVYDGSWTEWGSMVGMPVER